jgi:hypothetical protein
MTKGSGLNGSKHCQNSNSFIFSLESNVDLLLSFPNISTVPDSAAEETGDE